MACNQRAMAGADALLPPTMQVLSCVPRGWTWFREAPRLPPHGFASTGGPLNVLHAPRTMPPEVQEEAWRCGLIRVLPAPRAQDGAT